MGKNAKVILERIMIFSAVTAFMLSFMTVFECCVISELERPYLFSWFTYAITVFSGLVFMIVLELFVNEKTKLGVHLRFILFYLIAILVLSFFLGTEDVPYLLIPITIVHYFLESTVNDIFVYHDYFTEGYNGKTGKELVEYLFHNNVAALEFAAKRNSTRNTLFVLGFGQFVLLLIPSLLKLQVPFLSYIFALIFYFSLFIIFMMIGIFNTESYYAFLGFDSVVKNERKQYKLVSLIFIAGLLLALLFSSHHALINIPKISERTYELQKTYQYQDSFNDEDLPRPDFEMFSIPAKDRKPSRLAGILKIIGKIAKITGICVAGIFLLFLIFRPFFSAQWRAFLKEKRLYHFLLKIWGDFKVFVKALFTGKTADELYSTVGARTFSESIKEFIRGSKKSRAKKAELDRLTKQFMLLINWGSKRNVIYRKNLAPAEYTALLSVYFTEHSEKNYIKFCEKTGSLYEKALYDKTLLSPQEEQMFSESVDNILAFGNIK